MKIIGQRYRTLALVAASVVAVALVVGRLDHRPAFASFVTLASAGPFGLAAAATLASIIYAIEESSSGEQHP